MDLIIQRHAVMQWRDRHIIAAASLMNLCAVQARASFDQDLDSASFRGPMLDAQRVATSRIDAYMHENLKANLVQFWSVAAAELVAVDLRLRPLADSLQSASVDLLDQAAEPMDAQAEPSGTKSVDPNDEMSPTEPTGWLARLPGAVVDSAARAVGDVNTIAGTTIFETSGAADRLRKAASRRVSQAWMNDTDASLSALGQMIRLIDESAHAARIALS